MSRIIPIDLADTIPDSTEILERQGIPLEAIDEKLTLLADEAKESYARFARPRGLVLPVSLADFGEIYAGEGSNSEDSVLEEILPKAHRLTLFAITVGGEITDEINRLFGVGEYAQASMLDFAASAGAEKASERVTSVMWGEQSSQVEDSDKSAALPFSPGYCGWHVSGQKKLFAHLKPEKIGVRLSDTCLMMPLKSISGVIVVAPRVCFDIDDSYPFCVECANHSCRERWAQLARAET
jgi:cobalamin-dependent methionine synthase I